MVIVVLTALIFRPFKLLQLFCNNAFAMPSLVLRNCFTSVFFCVNSSRECVRLIFGVVVANF